ncbi:hypothetical protein NHX12_012149 [Muraenolepis orangiensis]|uniref:Uncharacterized protein n=1 Tax=Muraenolepis orangiensis TaxID=630683 RepID=A0A9Q0DL46_9TELE|nr:hypothetical protein NHX12_012149 [Muraenolepis orangiensis]
MERLCHRGPSVRWIDAGAAPGPGDHTGGSPRRSHRGFAPEITPGVRPGDHTGGLPRRSHRGFAPEITPGFSANDTFSRMYSLRNATHVLGVWLCRAFNAGGEQKPKYSFAPSPAINKMARPFAAGGASGTSGPVIKPVTYSPKLNTQRSQGPAGMQPHNGHGLRVENMPGFIPNDRSKKRLIEDTQDWQPRTGTTQSRSFRILAQLTGTDFMQDPDDENMKRAREKFLTEIQSPRYARLRDWHHDRSARALNIKS